MPKQFDTLIATNKSEVKRRKEEIIKTIKKSGEDKKLAKGSEDKDVIIKELESILTRMSGEMEDLEKNYDILESSFRKQLKRVYLNPYFRRAAKISAEQAGSGAPFIYNRESVYPHSDSLFL